MNSQNNPTNVIDFAQRNGQPPADRASNVVDIVRLHCVKRLTALVTTLFENADDTLFDLASKADTNAVQASYFDGMREVRKKRRNTEASFQERIGRQLADFATGRLTVPKPEATWPSSSSELTLSLVDDQELEESLAVGTMVAKAENRLQRPLFALNQRLAHLANQQIEDATNPIGPALIGQLFRESLCDLTVELPVRLIVYKLFDRFVLGALDILYDEVNGLLVHAGVLPQLHVKVAHRPSAPATPHARGDPAIDSADHSAKPEAGSYYDPTTTELQANLYTTLRVLLSSRRGETAHPAIYASNYDAGGKIDSLSATDLLSALAILQSQALSVQNQALIAQSADDAARIAQQVKNELIVQVDKLHGETRAKITDADEDTIDLVGMLFEYILQDRNLPAQIQALIGRLQIPFLKAALLDKHLFAHRTHPARQLLDALAQACVGWSEESDRDHRLHDKIKEIVDALLRDFENDIDIFDRLLTDFDTFVKASKRRAELAEQRTAEAARGREKLLAARHTAAREVMQRIENRELPELIKDLLLQPWTNYLVLVLLRQGETSEEWLEGLRFVDELSWSVQPKYVPAERSRLQDILPSLEKKLRHGLATVAFDENDMRQLMLQLHSLYTYLLSLAWPDEPVTMPPPPSECPSTKADLPVLEPIVSLPHGGGERVLATLEEEAAICAETVEKYFLEKVRALKVGTWIEFTDVQGNTERAKLSWVSPVSSKYLFVNRKGLKVADKNLQRLALEIATGRAAVLEEVPLFDRALDAIVERLKAMHVAPQSTTPAP